MISKLIRFEKPQILKSEQLAPLQQAHIPQTLIAFHVTYDIYIHTEYFIGAKSLAPPVHDKHALQVLLLLTLHHVAKRHFVLLL